MLLEGQQIPTGGGMVQLSPSPGGAGQWSFGAGRVWLGCTVSIAGNGGNVSRSLPVSFQNPVLVGLVLKALLPPRVCVSRGLGYCI